jgi:transcription antitermination factor NusB
MRKRTQAREIALQILYQIDVTNDNYREALDNFWQANEDISDTSVKDFTTLIVKGVTKHLEAVNQEISRYAENWQLSRMAVVERNILRLAAFELLFCKDIPPKVTINEAIELTKKFSGLEASKFVNGILDKIKQKRKK